PFDSPQKTNWSNLPTGAYQRNSLRLGDLTTAKRDAALALVASVLSTDGYRKVTDIMNGDEVLRNKRWRPDRSPSRRSRAGGRGRRAWRARRRRCIRRGRILHRGARYAVAHDTMDG